MLSRILTGPIYVRICGAITTGLLTSFIIWIIADNFLSLLVSHSTVAVPVAVGALAGAVMGGGRGLLVGAGFGWLVGVLAESSATELSKQQAEKHLSTLWVWCVSTTIGGLGGWVAERLFDKVKEKSPALGGVLQAILFFAAFAAVAMTLLGAGAPFVFWRIIHVCVPDVDRLQILVGGTMTLVVLMPFYVWCYASDACLSSIFLMRRVSEPGK